MSVITDDDWQGTGMRMSDWIRLPAAEKLRRALIERSDAQYRVLRRALRSGEREGAHRDA